MTQDSRGRISTHPDASTRETMNIRWTGIQRRLPVSRRIGGVLLLCDIKEIASIALIEMKNYLSWYTETVVRDIYTA
ncbi:MAG: hypothetical protein V2J65_26345 [Desulfobacteraceae bacterium]|jgi:hypothetical protein|nr:hypothetical protein [Desulfobacteraceae bacterium]